MTGRGKRGLISKKKYFIADFLGLYSLYLSKRNSNFRDRKNHQFWNHKISEKGTSDNDDDNDDDTFCVWPSLQKALDITKVSLLTPLSFVTMMMMVLTNIIRLELIYLDDDYDN